MTSHLFVSSTDGGLYDTRNPQWHKAAPLRANYRRTFETIDTVAQFKATLRNGAFAWPGGYPLAFLCDDGATLCFGCARKESRQIMPAIAARLRDGWRVVACTIDNEANDSDYATCEHCGESVDMARAKT